MKISIIVQDRFHAFDYAREFHRLGHLHQLITPYPKHITSRFGVPSNKVTSLLFLGILQRLLQRLPLPQKTKDTLEVWWLETYAWVAARALKECDVVVAWSSVATPAFEKAHHWGALCVCERGSSHILTQEQLLQEEHQLMGIPWIEWTDRKRNLELRDYDSADVIVVPSGFAESTFLEKGFSGSQIIRSAYGVDLASFSLSSERNADRFRVLSVGNMSVRKGIHYLYRGFKATSIKDSELWFVGSNTAETSKLIDTSDVQVQLLGHIPQHELKNIYSQASVFVIASIEEGLAMVQAQALACGLPLICTTNAGGEDLLQLSGKEPAQLDDGILQYPAGFVIPIRRPDCIARCLKMLAQDRGLYRSMSYAAAQISNENLDWSNVARRLIDLYASEVGNALERTGE